MEIIERVCTVQGVSFFDGQVDGKNISSGSVFVLQEMFGPNVKGARTVEKKCESAEVIKRIINLDYPLKMVLFEEERISKGAEKRVLVDVRPFEHVKSKDSVTK